jgi:hypothetical protein
VTRSPAPRLPRQITVPSGCCAAANLSPVDPWGWASALGKGNYKQLAGQAEELVQAFIDFDWAEFTVEVLQIQSECAPGLGGLSAAALRGWPVSGWRSVFSVISHIAFSYSTQFWG